MRGTREFIAEPQEMNFMPHVAQNTLGRRSTVSDAIAGSDGYAHFTAKAQAD
jgi:hypothetical protein